MHGTMATIALAAMLSTAASAHACRAVPPPHDPARVASDIVLLATVTDTDKLAGRDWSYDLRVDRVLRGTHPSRRHGLRWTLGGDGRCPARGPRLLMRDRVVIYLKRPVRGEPYEQGWMPVAEARIRDPRSAGGR